MQILQIENVKYDKDSKTTRYLFNDDKVVRINSETAETITKNVPEKYINLISVYNATHTIEKSEQPSPSSPAEEKDSALDRQRQIIERGDGTIIGVFLGVLLSLGMVAFLYIPIAGFIMFITIRYILTQNARNFMKNISDKEYVENEDPYKINKLKGFYSFSVFGLIVCIVCSFQWKKDLISVLDGTPTKPSKNEHHCFQTWAIAFVLLQILRWAVSFAVLIIRTATGHTPL